MLSVATGERVERESILVKPIFSKISRFCTSLTTLTQEQVDGGISFSEACKILVEKYRSPFRTWASYGDYDREMFTKQCADFGVTYPFNSSHINVKNLFALVHGLRHEVGMAKALALREIALEGTYHRGGDDAWNTGQLLAEILLSRRQIIVADKT